MVSWCLFGKMLDDQVFVHCLNALVVGVQATMVEPTIAADGHTYEGSAIQDWLTHSHMSLFSLCPILAWCLTKLLGWPLPASLLESSETTFVSRHEGKPRAVLGQLCCCPLVGCPDVSRAWV